MLVLTRKPGEKIHIGSDVTITVLVVKDNKIRIGIDAPQDVPVIRSELNEFHSATEADSPPWMVPSAIRTKSEVSAARK